MKQKSFELSKEQKELLEKYKLSSNEKILIEKFIKKYAVSCYYIKKVNGKPNALDSSLGAVPYTPEDKDSQENLLIQINFEGIDLLGYPNKGIFQIFMGPAEEKSLTNDGGTNVMGYYYKILTDKHRKNLSVSNNALSRGCFKIKLEEGWSMYPKIYDSFKTDEEKNLFEDCEILKQLENKDFDFWEIIYDIFPTRSNIGGYSHSPQGQCGVPFSAEFEAKNAIMLFLSNDIISWGDGGVFMFFYENIEKLGEEGSMIWLSGDMC